MATIALEGMKFKAYHGYYEEEQKIGNNFTVDLWVETDLSGGTSADDIEQTINYEMIYELVHEEMRQPAQLLETVGQRIIEQFRETFEEKIQDKLITKITVRLAKHRPPLPGRVEKATVTLSENFASP